MNYSRGTILFTALALLAPAQLASAQPEGKSRFAKLEEGRIHYTDYGAGGFALVFVHGWNCDESVWQAQASALSKKRHVITVDLLGHGESDKPEISYTMDLHARALDAVLRDTGVKSAVLIGHSNGTPVVRQFYRRYSEKVVGLVIVDGALRPFGDAAMMERFIAPLRGRDYQPAAGRFINGMTGPMKFAAQRDQIKAMMQKTPQQVAVSEMEGLLDSKLWEHDPIDVPVLMILAKQPAWTPEYESFAREIIPALDYQMWDDVSHFVMMDKPDDFNSAVLKFLKDHKLPKK